jgi:hypothetical protein
MGVGSAASRDLPVQLGLWDQSVREELPVPQEREASLGQ